jgi:hypothetical protein
MNAKPATSAQVVQLYQRNALSDPIQAQGMINVSFAQSVRNALMSHKNLTVALLEHSAMKLD